MTQDSPFLDNLTMISWAQKLVASEVHDDCVRLKKEESKKQQQESTGATAQVESLSESDQRVKVLENYLRPALLKNETWTDVSKWRFNNRLIKWARAEFLKAKHGPNLQDALIGYPKLRSLPQLAARRRMLNLFQGSDSPKTTSAVFLPPTSMIEDAFGLEKWTQKKDRKPLKRHLERIASKLDGSILELRSGALLFADIPMNADLSPLSLEEILEVAGGHVTFCNAFNVFCEEANIYQLWTKEYVDRLAKYLLKRTREFKGETVILDIGAGDGLLAKYLHSSMGKILLSETKENLSQNWKQRKPTKNSQEQQAKVPNIVAVDDGSWNIAEKAIVERLSVEEALTKYCPGDSSEEDAQQQQHHQQTIVLCSWMPMDVDWTALFRQSKADEYILIGECDDGTCGANWETWGNPAFLSDELTQDMLTAASSDQEELDEESDDKGSTNEEIVPPYEVDGYKRIDMEALAPYQFSRFDSSTSKTGRTVAFRRAKR